MINKTGDLFQSASVQPVPTPKMPYPLLKDMLHQRIRQWTVIGGPRRRSDGHLHTEWLCCCDCGTERWLRGTDLRCRPLQNCGGPSHPPKKGRPPGRGKPKERTATAAPVFCKAPTPEELKYWRQFAVSQCMRCRKETSIPLRHELMCKAAMPPKTVLVPTSPPAILPAPAEAETAYHRAPGQVAFTLEPWTVLGGLRMQPTAAGKVHLTRCVCACGAIRWLTEAQLRQVPPVPCRGVKHQPSSPPVETTPVPRSQRSNQPVDMLHQKINEWTVTGGPRTRANDPYRLKEWLCVCSCGTERWLTTYHLRYHPSPDCGGPSHPARPPQGGARFIKNMLHQKIKQWTVIGGPEHRQGGRFTKVIMWLCVCDCGTQRWIRGSDLRSKPPKHRCKTKATPISTKESR